MSTGPLRAELVDELEALKFALADMSAGDIAADDAGAIAAEISAIRLQLKRLAFERRRSSSGSSATASCRSGTRLTASARFDRLPSAKSLWALGFTGTRHFWGCFSYGVAVANSISRLYGCGVAMPVHVMYAVVFVEAIPL